MKPRLGIILGLILALVLAPPVAAKCKLGGLRAVEGLIAVGLAYEFSANRFARLNHAADQLERAMPGPLNYNRLGDPITWGQHAAWTATAGAIGGAVGKAVGSSFRCGFREFTRLAVFLFYGPREVNDAIHHAPERGAFRDARPYQPYQRGAHLGYAFDGFADFLFPLGVHVSVRAP